jgi:hypothetical protein
MSGSNQQAMPINLRRMELPAFIELLSMASDQTSGDPGRQQGAMAEKAVPFPVPLMGD